MSKQTMIDRAWAERMRTYVVPEQTSAVIASPPVAVRPGRSGLLPIIAGAMLASISGCALAALVLRIRRRGRAILRDEIDWETAYVH